MFNKPVRINEEGFINWSHPVIDDWLFHSNLRLSMAKIERGLEVKSKVVKTPFTKLSLFLYKIGFRVIPCKIQYQLFVKDSWRVAQFPEFVSNDVQAITNYIIAFHKNELLEKKKETSEKVTVINNA